MSVRSPVISSVIEIIAARAAIAIDVDEGVQLGSNGLGLDSIAIAEVLLDCERRFGVRMTDLLGGDAITIGRLTEHIEQNLPS
jgi:acyl carrier protein